jgi:hypothetical protein
MPAFRQHNLLDTRVYRRSMSPGSWVTDKTDAVRPAAVPAEPMRFAGCTAHGPPSG